MFILRSLIAHTSPKTSMELMTPLSSLSRIVSIARKTPVRPTPALEIIIKYIKYNNRHDFEKLPLRCIVNLCPFAKVYKNGTALQCCKETRKNSVIFYINRKIVHLLNDI